MSAYKEHEQQCDPTKVVLIYDELTGTCVYAFCPEHQDEYVHPVYSFNLDYFRMYRETIIEIANKVGLVPHVTMPHSFIANKVYTSQESLAEALFKAEVSDE